MKRALVSNRSAGSIVVSAVLFALATAGIASRRDHGYTVKEALNDVSYHATVFQTANANSVTSGPQLTIALHAGVAQLVAQEIRGVSSFCAVGGLAFLGTDAVPNGLLPSTTAETEYDTCVPQDGSAGESLAGDVFNRAFMGQREISGLQKPAPSIQSSDSAVIRNVDAADDELRFEVELTDFEPRIDLQISGLQPIPLEPVLTVVGRPFTVTILHADGMRPDIALVGKDVSIKIPGNMTATGTG